MKRARFVAAARREFLLEVTHYDNERKGLGTRFANSVEEATARALAFPQAGSVASRNTRRIFLKEFPFAIVYRQDSDGIVVFALAHHSRLPDYWLSRVQER